MVSFKHLAFILFFFSCASEVKTPQLFSLPPTKYSRPDLVEKTMFSLGLMTDYEVWEFLRNKPAESLVLENIGLPDSVWRSDNDSTKFLYYYIDSIQDYNIIEVNSFNNLVTGFEWD